MHVSFVERPIILCPFVGGSTIGGSIVFTVNFRVHFMQVLSKSQTESHNYTRSIIILSSKHNYMYTEPQA